MVAHFAPVLPAAVSRVLATFNRAQVEGFIAIAIDLLDLADAAADPDVPLFAAGRHDGAPGDIDDAEDDGDAEDHDSAEDDFIPHSGDGAGCPLADPGGLDVGEDDQDLRPVADPGLTQAHRDRIRRNACRASGQHRTVEVGGWRGVSMDACPFELRDFDHLSSVARQLAATSREARA